MVLMCVINLSSESKSTPRFYTDCDGLKSQSFGKSFSPRASGPMTKSSVFIPIEHLLPSMT